MPVDDIKCLIAVPTFRRPQFIPRILACFDRLDYVNKRMVIINDDPDTKLVYNDDPRVEVLNIDKQLQLSIKRNLFNCWNYDIIFPLDDDDLFLPNRITNHIKAYTESPQSIDLYRNTSCYLAHGNKLQISQKSSFTNSSYTREGFLKSGGYTSYTQSNLDDASLRTNFTNKCKCHVVTDNSNIDFVYDFGGKRYRNTFNNEAIMGSSLADRTINERESHGEIILKPDYETYDTIISICSEVTEGNPIPLQFSDNNASFYKKIN